MNLIDQGKQIKIDHPDWGRRKISAELGVSEKRVRMALESLRTPNENGIRSIRHYNQQSVIDAVVHLKDVNDRDEILRAVKLDPAKWDCIDALVKAWQMGSKDASGKPQVTDLYSVSVKARPKQGFDLGVCIERINSIGIKPVEVVPDKNVGRKGLLEVFLTDMHFGVNTLEDYTDTQNRLDETQRVSQCQEIPGIQLWRGWTKGYLLRLGDEVMTFEHTWDAKTQTWVVYRVGKDRHAHLGSESGCLKLISLIKQGKLPHSDDFRECCKRLLSDEEYAHLGKSKGRYYNHQRRVGSG